MPLETCQMLSIVCSEKWGHGYGEIHRLDGEPYKTEKGAFRNHPCTIWANASLENTWWLMHTVLHCVMNTHIVTGKIHSCEKTLEDTTNYYPLCTLPIQTKNHFAFAVSDEFKYDKH